MKVILLKELKGRGGEGDVIDVARGFANNYLLTQGYAIRATKGNLKELEQRRNNIAKREEVRLANANELAEKLDGTNVNVIAQVGDEGQLFGSVTSAMIAEAINASHDVNIDKHRVDLRKPIKTTGEYPVSVSIYRDIKANVNVVVTGEEPAEEQEIPQQSEEAENKPETDVTEGEASEKEVSESKLSDTDSEEANTLDVDSEKANTPDVDSEEANTFNVNDEAAESSEDIQEAVTSDTAEVEKTSDVEKPEVDSAKIEQSAVEDDEVSKTTDVEAKDDEVANTVDVEANDDDAANISDTEAEEDEAIDTETENSEVDAPETIETEESAATE